MNRRRGPTAQETKQMLADAQQQPSHEEGNRGERQLQRESEQEAGLEDSIEREALGVKQPLADLLERECEQRQQEEAASAETAAFEFSRASEQAADPEHGHEREGEAKPHHGMSCVSATSAFVKTCELAAIAIRGVARRRSNRGADRMRCYRARDHQWEREEPGEPWPKHGSIVARAPAAIHYLIRST